MSESYTKSSNSNSESDDSSSDENNNSSSKNLNENQCETKESQPKESSFTDNASLAQNELVKKEESSSSSTEDLKEEAETKTTDKEDASNDENPNEDLNKPEATSNEKDIQQEEIKSEKKPKTEKKRERRKSEGEKPKTEKKRERRKSEGEKAKHLSEKIDDKKEKASEEIKKSEETNQKTNTQDIPKMVPMRSSLVQEGDNADYPYKKRKSTVTFEFPAAQNEDNKDGFNNIRLKKRSKSDDDIRFPQMGMHQDNDDNAHDFVSEPMEKEPTQNNRLSATSINKLNMDPRSVPRRFSKMTIEQIDEVIETEDRLLDAITFFNKNKDPSKLCEYYELEDTPSNIAQIFWGTKDINSNVLGQYLLKKKDMLDAYFMEVEMNKGPIQSLRNALLGPMRFDGESQTVHKVLSAISRCYASKNPEKCDDPDKVLDLYYALIMLNTDLSNPNNKTKMTLDEFIRNTKGANEYLSTLSDEELTGYYKNIQKHPLLFQNQSDDFIYDICPKIRGYLKKKSLHTFGTWTKKYFVLIKNRLYYFSDDNPENAKTPLGAVYLKGVEPLRNRDTSPLLIRIIAKKKEVKYVKYTNGQKSNPRVVKGIKEIILEAPDRASSSKWFHRIRVAAQMSNFLKKESLLTDESSNNNVYGTDVPDAADDSVEECEQ